MHKRDTIFWYAGVLFILSLGLFIVTHNQLWLALMIGSYLLRPTLASLGVARRLADERQVSIQNRSGNLAFTAMIVICACFVVKLSLENNHAFELFAMVIIAGLATKALFNVLWAEDPHDAASKIIIGAGLLIGLFSVLDVGDPIAFAMSALPGLVVAGVGLLARKHPRPVGFVIIIVTAALVLLVMTIGLKNSGKLWSQIVIAVIIGAPLLTAGISLFRPVPRDVEPVTGQ